jgi:FLYWCH zinc finger domain
VRGGIYYEPSKRSGQHLLIFNGFRYFRNRKRGNKQYWKCSYYYKTKCPSIVIVDEVNECFESQHLHVHVTQMHEVTEIPEVIEVETTE